MRCALSFEFKNWTKAIKYNLQPHRSDSFTPNNILHTINTRPHTIHNFLMKYLQTHTAYTVIVCPLFRLRYRKWALFSNWSEWKMDNNDENEQIWLEQTRHKSVCFLLVFFLTKSGCETWGFGVLYPADRHWSSNIDTSMHHQRREEKNSRSYLNPISRKSLRFSFVLLSTPLSVFSSSRLSSRVMQFG